MPWKRSQAVSCDNLQYRGNVYSKIYFYLSYTTSCWHSFSNELNNRIQYILLFYRRDKPRCMLTFLKLVRSIFIKRNHFKNYKKCFLFHLKSFFLQCIFCNFFPFLSTVSRFQPSNETRIITML